MDDNKTNKALLEGVFSFKRVSYKAQLFHDGIHWTRANGKGELRVFLLKHMFGVVEYEKSFKVVGVCVGKDPKEGRRKERFAVFNESTKGYSDHSIGIIKEWVNKIRELLEKLRPPSKRAMLILVNPFGGKGKGVSIWKSAQPYFDTARINYEVIITEYAGHARKIANELDLKKYRSVVTVSGDGLLSEVINGINDRDDSVPALRQLTFGIIPAGSGNALAASLHCPNVITAVYGIVSGDTHAVDGYSVIYGDQHFVGFVSVTWGTLASIDVDSDEYRFLGPLRFDIKGVMEAVSCDSYKGKVWYLPIENESELTVVKEQSLPDHDTIQLQHFTHPSSPPAKSKRKNNTKDKKKSKAKKDHDDKDAKDKGGESPNSAKTESVTSAIDVGDDPTKTNPKWVEVEGKFSIFLATVIPRIMKSPNVTAKRGHVSDGCMDLLFAHDVDRIQLTQLLLGVENGAISDHPCVKYVKVKAIKLEPDNSKKSTPLSLDGERYESNPISIEVHQGLFKCFYDDEVVPGEGVGVGVEK